MCYSCPKDGEVVKTKEPTCTRCSNINPQDGVEDANVTSQTLEEVEGGQLSTLYCDKLPNNVSKAYDFSKVVQGEIC